MAQEIKEFENLSELLSDLDREGITGIEKRRIAANFLLRKSRLHGRPYSASFELTPLCNFDCKMCYVHLTKAQMEKERPILTTEEWLDIARQSVDAGVNCIDITGGECLTHPGFCELYLYLINRGVQVSVLTNGSLITEKHIKLFAQYKPVSVQISLYGSSPDAYIKVTGHDHFRDVINAVEQLKRARIHVTLSVMPNRFMQEDSEALLNLLHRINVDYTIGSTTIPARGETGRKIADYIIDNDAYIAICKQEMQYRKQLAESLSPQLLPEAAMKPYQYRIKGQESFTGAPCAAGAANFHINWKGEMQPCIGFQAVKHPVLNCGIEEAWAYIRETMNSYRPPAECASCELRDVCLGCVAEKTGGILNGALNSWVCKRMHASFKTDCTLHESGECTI